MESTPHNNLCLIIRRYYFLFEICNIIPYNILCQSLITTLKENKMKSYTSISTRLKELRIKNKYSQTYVAEYLNISRQAISRWETGYATPDLDNLVLLAKLYNTSVDELLGVYSENSPSQKSVDPNQITSIISSLEMIGLSVVLVLSMLFPFVPIIVSVLITFWLKANKRNYPFVYALCAICLMVGIFNTYVFFIHAIPNTGTSSITPV